MKKHNFKYLLLLFLVLLLALFGFLIEGLAAKNSYFPEQNIATIDTLLKYYRRNCTDDKSFNENKDLCTTIAQTAVDIVINKER